MTMTSRQRSLPFYVDVLWRFRVSEIEVGDFEVTKLVSLKIYFSNFSPQLYFLRILLTIFMSLLLSEYPVGMITVDCCGILYGSVAARF